MPKSIYDLQNFAYIVSFGDVEQQDVHIDLCDINHYQLAMLCSPVGELTNEYRCTDSEFNHVEGDNLTKLWVDLPPSLQVKLNKITEIQSLIDGFGPLLSPPSIKLVWEPYDMVAFGTMLLLPGRVMHCGPKVTRQNSTVTGNNMLRSVMFLTATPKNNLASAYDSEIQYCRSPIIHDILLYSWPSLNAKEKKYMLTKWEEVGLSNDSMFAITINMKHVDLKVIALELKRTPKDKMKRLISRIANDPVWKRKGYHNRWDREDGGEPYRIPISR